MRAGHHLEVSVRLGECRDADAVELLVHRRYPGLVSLGAEPRHQDFVVIPLPGGGGKLHGHCSIAVPQWRGRSPNARADGPRCSFTVPEPSPRAMTRPSPSTSSMRAGLGELPGNLDGLPLCQDLCRCLQVLNVVGLRHVENRDIPVGSGLLLEEVPSGAEIGELRTGVPVPDFSTLPCASLSRHSAEAFSQSVTWPPVPGRQHRSATGTAGSRSTPSRDRRNGRAPPLACTRKAPDCDNRRPPLGPCRSSWRPAPGCPTPCE